jgi:hypothetical protein
MIPGAEANTLSPNRPNSGSDHSPRMGSAHSRNMSITPPPVVSSDPLFRDINHGQPSLLLDGFWEFVHKVNPNPTVLFHDTDIT